MGARGQECQTNARNLLLRMVSVLMHIARNAECDSYVVLGVIVQVQAVPRTTCLAG